MMVKMMMMVIMIARIELKLTLTHTWPVQVHAVIIFLHEPVTGSFMQDQGSFVQD